MNCLSATVRLPAGDESIAPVTILDAQGTPVRVVAAAEFRQAHPDRHEAKHSSATRRRGRD